MFIVVKKFANGRKVRVAEYMTNKAQCAYMLCSALEECAIMDKEKASFEVVNRENKLSAVFEFFRGKN